jgi:hypothetical protein
MSSTVTENPMVKKNKQSEPGPAPKTTATTTTKVDRELLRKARALADFRRIDLYDYIDGKLRNQVETEYRQMVRKEADE